MEGRASARRPRRPRSAAGAGTPLGLYLHIPFCRKRCKFCYFRVYTDKNARDVEVYLDALTREVELYRAQADRRRPAAALRLLRRRHAVVPQRDAAARPVRQGADRSFPGTRRPKSPSSASPARCSSTSSKRSKKSGVTRLSLGIENFDDKILEINGRAHLSAEIFRAYDWARDLHFPQINIDLIAGMVGETWDNWRECVRKTIDLSPDSVTIYQMELPFNTVYFEGAARPGPRDDRPGADRRLADEAGLGRLRLRRHGEGRLRGFERLHDGQGQEPLPVRLPRQPLARRRHVRHRRRVVRPRRRRSRAERRSLGAICRPRPSGRLAARSRPARRTRPAHCAAS